MDVSPILQDLNKPQREAVTAPLSPTLVLAGAGSGKTRVLVHRIAWLMSVEAHSPFSILAVTFTNKAAAEMRSRIEALHGQPLGGMWVGTFHSIAHRLLRRHWEEAQLAKNFQILDSDDQLRMVKRVIRGLELDEKQWVPRQAQWYINAKKDEGLRAASLEDKGDFHEKTMIRIYSQYEQQCQLAGVIDFAEMLLRSLELLRDNPKILDHYQSRFRHILVDEFQDTNTLQYGWLRLLAGDHTPIFAVGDDDQSIYGWRGAKIENIRDFSRHFPETKQIKLEQNYRSTSTILDAANAVIANNTDRLGKNLWTEDNPGSKIQLYAAFNENDEAQYVASQIKTWASQGNSRQDCAILYRSNAQSRVFESALLEHNIPYRVYGGLRFFERAEIKDALAYLRMSAHRDDDPSFERIVNHPPRGIGNRTIEIIRGVARENNVSMWGACRQLTTYGSLNNRAKKAILDFMQVIDDTANLIAELPLFEQVEKAIQSSGLKAHFLAKEAKDKGQERNENLDELITAAQSFEYRPHAEHEDMDFLTAFLSHASLEAGDGQGKSGEDCVQLMTMHSAKGLEFPLVFVCGVEEGLFPHQNSIDEPGRLEEERRLCYVAITRAMQHLHLSHAESRRLYNETKFNAPSVFLQEIPVQLINVVRSANYNKRAKPVVAPPPRVRSVNETGYRVGQKVSHASFGEGVITDTEGSGQGARVQVNFSSAGSKWLVLAYAKLQA